MFQVKRNKKCQPGISVFLLGKCFIISKLHKTLHKDLFLKAAADHTRMKNTRRKSSHLKCYNIIYFISVTSSGASNFENCLASSGFKFVTRILKSTIFHIVLRYRGEENPIIKAGIYLLKVNNGSNTTMYKICSNLTIKAPEWCHWHRSGVFIVNLEQIPLIDLVFPMLNLYKLMSAGKHIFEFRRTESTLL